MQLHCLGTAPTIAAIVRAVLHVHVHDNKTQIYCTYMYMYAVTGKHSYTCYMCMYTCSFILYLMRLTTPILTSICVHSDLSRVRACLILTRGPASIMLLPLSSISVFTRSRDSVTCTVWERGRRRGEGGGEMVKIVGNGDGKEYK